MQEQQQQQQKTEVGLSGEKREHWRCETRADISLGWKGAQSSALYLRLGVVLGIRNRFSKKNKNKNKAVEGFFPGCKFIQVALYQTCSLWGKVAIGWVG